jgi:N,N'-diacetylchitobiose phosphorylase
MKKILDFTANQLGAHGIAKGLRADWNDCLNLGGGESAMVAFLHLWALNHFLSAAEWLGRTNDVKHYAAMRDKMALNCQKVLWNGKWFIRGITGRGEPIGDVTPKRARCTWSRTPGR